MESLWGESTKKAIPQFSYGIQPLKSTFPISILHVPNQTEPFHIFFFQSSENYLKRVRKQKMYVNIFQKNALEET